ncbi:hypothetical protein MPTK1_7g01980 [Marchantia polymorpha subsp. ruderalis]|uniref:CP12 domain-containing protein n=2 Tax=Marchantia polymorpha TaxID=3197 RepID=A0AAF6BV89_MARPO|nr:hypothetical protein MARPO_0088s0088 [Marchantia polymorpha]BBN15923.1 hypothetical protein Mp_7g01980 [Marchantia polymorpha subsp. ruderalis]|eukprot:PTQ33548.1 hypothetical protein MARPO_0088s0088 [Marchantia polymorpha]
MAFLAMESSMAACKSAAPCFRGARSMSFSSSTSLRMASPVTPVAPMRARVVVMCAVPKEAAKEIQKITELINKRVHEAEEKGCESDPNMECVARWEEIEELSAARAHKKALFTAQAEELKKKGQWGRTSE